MNNLKFYCLVPSSSFLRLDMRDRISLVLGFCEALKIHSSECLLNFESEETKLYQLMGFRMNHHKDCLKVSACPDSSIFAIFEIFEDKLNAFEKTNTRHEVKKRYLIRDCDGYGHYSLVDDIEAEVGKINVPFFYKASELHSRGGFKKYLGSFENRFCYVSGYAQDRPPNHDVIIGPEWEWMTDKDVRLSGVNFMSEFIALDDDFPKVKKKYRCIYVGSSSINKLAPLALLILMLTRLGSKGEIYPDIFMCFRFYGFKGSLVWYLLKTLKILAGILRFDIEIILSETKIDKKTVEYYITKSQLGVIPYLREGFPRIIGDMMLNNCEPIILNWMRYGGREFESLVDLKYTIFDAIKKIGKAKKSFTTDRAIFKKAIPFFQPEQKVRDLLSCNKTSELLRSQLRWVNKASISKYFYTILTNDITWSQKMLNGGKANDSA